MLSKEKKQLIDEMLNQRFHKSKQLLDTYGNVYRGVGGNYDIMALMKQA